MTANNNFYDNNREMIALIVVTIIGALIIALSL